MSAEAGYHRVLISGDREWWPEKQMLKVIRGLKLKHGDRLIVIAGGAPGVDTCAEMACYAESVHIAVVKALWPTRHRGAGPQRNTAMLRGLRPDEFWWFHRNLAVSKGTKDMVKQVKRVLPPAAIHGITK